MNDTQVPSPVQHSSRSLHHSKRGVTAIEMAVAVAVLGGFFVVALMSHRQTLRRARELALEAELRNLRAGVVFFESTHGRRPATLEELRTQPIGRVRMGKESSTWGPFRDVSQALTDPFGHPYRYEPATGAVASATPGCETW